MSELKKPLIKAIDFKFDLTKRIRSQNLHRCAQLILSFKDILHLEKTSVNNKSLGNLCFNALFHVKLIRNGL